MFDVIKCDGYFDFGWTQFSFVIRGTATNCKSFEMDPPTKQMIRYLLVNSQLWNFKHGGFTKARFLTKIQQPQRKLLYFVNIIQ